MRYPYQLGDQRRDGSRAMASGAAWTLGMVACALLFGFLLGARAGAQTRAVRARDLYYEPDEVVGGAAAVNKAPVAFTHHLALRYNLIQIDPATRDAHVVDPDANFSRGNCFALELSPNRKGHLYIFDQGSSGEWQMLLPSAAMPDETSTVSDTVHIPAEYCFMLTDPPGVETLVVVVTEQQEDIDKLRQAIRGEGGRSGPDMKAVRNEVQRWEQQMSGRDLIMETVDQPKSASEQKNTVYVAKTSTGEASRFVFEIKIRHEQK
jgi:hypothetical protein